MNKHFMVDIETTGIDPTKEDLLQVGALELNYENGFWVPGRSFLIHQHTDRTPQGEFAKKHMVDLYSRCNQINSLPPEEIRSRLLEFFQGCGATPPEVYLMGWNAAGFDVPFMIHHGVLVPSTYRQNADGTETRIGDFNYRIYELAGAIAFASDITGFSRPELLSKADEVSPTTIPPGKQHDALYDCYTQTKCLNGLIQLTRK